MRIEVLGSVRLSRADDDVPFPGGNVGRLLERFLLQPNTDVPAEALCDDLWPELPASDPSTRSRLHVTVSRLRAFLRDAGTSAADRWYLEAGEGGYRLVVPPGALDRLEFERFGHEALQSGDPALAQRALELWRGAPFGGFTASALVRVEAAHLGELRRRLMDLSASLGPDERLLRAKVRPTWPAGRLVQRTMASSAPPVGAVPLLAVIAPAGFGKSTFLAQWAERQERPVAWLNLDEADDDPVVFWAGVARALTEALGDIDLTGTASVGSTVMLERLAHSLEDSQLSFGLVLDDVHRLTNPRLLDDIARLLASLPPACTVALASRIDLPLTVAPLVAGRSVHIVGPGDLRFTVDEITELTEGDRSRARWLSDRTDGWPVAAVAMHRTGAELDEPAPAVVVQYIGDEIIDGLPPDVRRFTIEVAHLDAFTVDLCEVVTGRADAGATLGWLRERGLFVVDTDPITGEGWCRFHPLIAEVARRRGAATINVSRLWGRAAAWCNARGLTEQALDYALRGRDRESVAELAGDVLLEAAIRGQALRCLQWLRLMSPDDLVGDDRAHGIALYLVVEWMERDDRGPWLRSRQKHFGGDDDVVWTLVSAIEAMREGAATRAVELSEQVMHRCLDGSLPEIAELTPLLLGSAFSNLIRARVLQDTARHDDSLFPSAIGLIRPHSPLLAGWVNSFWGLVAFVDGERELATSLAEEFYQVRLDRELGRTVRRDNSMLGALVASSRTTDAAQLRRLADGIEDLPPMFESGGQHTEATIARTILASIYERAGAPELAAPHQRLADAMLRTFEDAPFLRRFRQQVADLGRAPGSIPSAASLELLTPRQQAIARYLASDLSAEEIAADLFISYQTLRTHLRDMYRRLGVHSRHEAVALLSGQRSLQR